MLTSMIPLLTSAILEKASLLRSIILPLVKGPLSFIRTFIFLLFSTLVTSTILPNGRLGWAAVRALSEKISPLAVELPLNLSTYYDAYPEYGRLAEGVPPPLCEPP